MQQPLVNELLLQNHWLWQLVQQDLPLPTQQSAPVITPYPVEHHWTPLVAIMMTMVVVVAEVVVMMVVMMVVLLMMVLLVTTLLMILLTTPLHKAIPLTRKLIFSTLLKPFNVQL